MKEWLHDVAPLTLKGRIAVPYTWWVGETGSRFLMSLRDDERILGNRCTRCSKVYVPPRKNCGRCFEEITDWMELGSEGVVKAHAVVRYAYAMQPAKPPFAYALIRLDGADVDFLHIVQDNLDRLHNGVRVRARFRKERSGHILDIQDFQILDR